MTEGPAVPEVLDGTASEPYDVLIIGGGPAGLSAALNLARSLARVLIVDADRPRNAATINSHGFLTRDGIPPHELRKLARAELADYPSVEIRTRQRVLSVARTEDPDPLFTAWIGRTTATETVQARAVLLATGLRETLPEVPDLRGFYGMSLFSCAACDGFEMRDRPIALIGQSDDLADRARLVARWSRDLTVFTHGAPVIDAVAEAELAALGLTVERRPIRALIGEKGRLEAAELEDGTRIPLEGGFVRPEWSLDLGFLSGIDPQLDDGGHLITDGSGRTSERGLYAAGDAASPGPQQLIVAAGAGARAAAVIVHDSLGVTTAH
ncbi:NAD(P)/FAD-dependent oxidoreductase [Microbacterium capsulatum]|uniref:NAD(P)/FAD-dependent oxidoreductase n=1 Tax=Microbacterium capsulatum TaxID=3041921 RepID=A0ABU0XIK6_9MICO|nr:NAD(P)/FAD-dependent oxidoreductase [Microbacterium sp. ASV81]MDQ4214951.1 NAD(P)/FAD-dependent oxidoreductase [Microbacterium sp. ASV81]